MEKQVTDQEVEYDPICVFFLSFLKICYGCELCVSAHSYVYKQIFKMVWKDTHQAINNG